MFANASPPFNRDALAAGLRALAAREIFIGTSSWKYEGWVGSLYGRDRYVTRGKFSSVRFERECLEEYAEVFSTVCVDAGYYRFPSPEWIKQLMETTPERCLFTFKVTDEITTRKFPKLDRHGARAGQLNENFLNAGLFQEAFLASLAPWQHRTGVLIFEFSHFHPGDFGLGRDFVDALDHFLGALPRGWRYGVEIRNRSLLRPEYFDMLQRHGVAHVFNQWTRMPDIGEQMLMSGSLNCADFSAARFLLRQGRTFEEAVKMFSPYESIKDPNESVRDAGAELIRTTLDAQTKEGHRPRRLFLYVNNRLEGNALETIRALLLRLEFLKPIITNPSAKLSPPERLL